MNQATRNLIVAATVAFFAAAVQAQTPTTSSSATPSQTQTPQQSPNGGYIQVDPLAGVRYDNRWDVSLGMGYAHAVAGPNLREAAGLGGLDLSASYWLTKHWGIEGSARGYLGTSGVPATVHDVINGPFIAEYMFMAGPEYLGPHNKHAAVVFHALAGGAYNDYDTDIRKPYTPASVGFYDNQLAFGGVLGAHIDLNRSAHWAFRVTPDALITGYGSTSQYSHIQWNFGISVGAQYKFKGKR